MSKDTSGSAFPTPDKPLPNHGISFVSEGLTIRQWYAGLALQGLYHVPAFWMANIDDYAQKAFQTADAMILEGSK